MENMDLNTSKRQRKNAGHRWLDPEIKALLVQICELLKDDVEVLEKPTAQKFYEQVAAGQEVLQGIHWSTMKGKLRYLKKLYMSAREWKNNTGAGLMADGKEQSVTDYVNKICPHFDLLDEIYAKRKGVNPGYIFSTSDGDFSADVDDFHDVSYSEATVLLNDSSSELEFTATDAQPQTENKKKKRLKRQASTPLQELVALQEKKLELENKKLEWEMNKFERQQQLEIKKLELEKEERMERLKLESQQKLKMFQMELEYKNQKDL